MNYFLGLAGMWIFADGIISIRLYLNAKDETGKRTQCWLYDHSIRVIRILIGIGMMVIGGLNVLCP